MKRIGIIGGSFNPPHLGHLHIAKEAREILGFDEVWLWVSYNIFKDPSVYAPLSDRVAMTKLLAQDYPWLKTVDIEKDFSDTMTATSLTMLQAMYPEDRFTWIFGDDNFSSFHNWNREKFKIDNKMVPDWQYILNNFSIAVMHRPGYREASQNGIAAKYAENLFVNNPLKLGELNGWTFIDNSTLSISSTQIKEKLLIGARDIEGLTSAIENHIYSKGLLNTRSDFNSTSQKSATGKNPVRFDTFLLLASAANLVKSVGMYNQTFDANALILHGSKSWDKSFAKGDFKKKEEIPGEIADCLISLYWIASPHGFILPGEKPEDQESVVQWCNLHYPDRDIKQRIKDYIEELAELCVCEGLEKHRLINLLNLVFNDPQLADLQESFEKNYAVLKEYAQNAGGDLDSMLQEKMTLNRLRSKEESASRLSIKELSMDRNLE